MATGLVAIRKKFHPQFGIEKQPIIVGTMYLVVAFDAGQLGAETTVLCTMPGRNGMALQAHTITPLVKQTIVGRTMRLVAFNTAAAIYQMIVDHLMLIQKGTGDFGVAFLTAPIQSNCQQRILDPGRIMTVGATNIARFQWMYRTPLKFHPDRGVTGKAIIIAIIGDQHTT